MSPRSKTLKSQLKRVHVGDLIYVSWYDASIGKSLRGNKIDVPVKSWGIFLGIMGQRKKHIVLSQNNFQFSNGFFDIDYTAIPVGWANEITVISAHAIEDYEVDLLVKSFMMGQRHSRVAQRRVKNHG